MSSRTTSPNLQSSLVLPKIILGTYEKINNLSKNIEQIILSKDTLEPIAFNQILKTTKAQIYGFLSRIDKVNSKCIENAINIFDRYPMINFVYIDVHRQLLPSFRIPMLDVIYQAPVFFKQTQELFDEKSTTYFNDMILNLSKISIGYQING